MRRVGTALVLILLAAALWALAAWTRLRVLDQVVVGSDSLGPYLQAWSLSLAHVQAGALPRPPNPESGDFLWITMLPLVHAARSLQELFRLRFVVGAAVAPLGFLATWVWAAREDGKRVWTEGRWSQLCGAVAAGVVLAVDPGLVDTLVSGARGYAAPEVAALLTLLLALAWRGSAVAGIAAACVLVVAMDLHPLAAGLGLGCLLLLPGMGERMGYAELGTAFLFGLLFALPRLLRLLALAQCGPDAMACLAEVARSNVHGDESVQLLFLVAAHDRLLVDLGPGVVIGLSVGLVLSKPYTGAGALALGGLLGMLLIGGATGYLQSYHLRILAAPLAVGAGVGLSRLWPLALAWAGWAAWTELPALPQGLDPGAAARHDQVAAMLADEAGPLWVDRVWWDGPPVLDASGVVLAGLLQGQDPERFRVGPEVPLVLLSVGQGTAVPGRELAAGTAGPDATPWTVVRVAGRGVVRQVIDHGHVVPHQEGGAWDWLVALQPEGADLEQTRW